MSTIFQSLLTPHKGLRSYDYFENKQSISEEERVVKSRTNVPAHKRGRPTPRMMPAQGSTDYNRMIRSAPTPPPTTEGSDHCEYYAVSCMRAYNTGVICGRTVYLTYYTFTNYCMLDYTNCMERHEVWQIAHYGPCFNISLITLEKHFHYEYTDDYWLDAHVVDPTV
ncbi:uncharacterized protein LOC128680448 isoform X2 [Plodia interpunctella]|nr:uncharacterized protein LOC128680448 isoform X2 [Plodia interpunctella]XP_053619586.1 uncharacterized protein LOC128680448 isoform X2 [Plodia interpunctella]XP_053619587.1 uncharacterized protein LOC128680448 isoform X2 [Plodia interpunctella]